ncbi:hypothetical protein KI387_005175, partial [Taxus chinensis]
PRIHFDEVEEKNAKLFECVYLKKEKGNMVYVVDEEEVENFDIDHLKGTREVLDSVDKEARVYHEPMKNKKVNIDMDVEPKVAIIGDYWYDFKVDKIIELL